MPDLKDANVTGTLSDGSPRPKAASDANPYGTGHSVNQAARAEGIDGLVSAESVKRICAVPARECRQLIEALERHYAAELSRLNPSWLFYFDGHGQPPVDVAETIGVPGVILGSVLAGKCRDQHIPVTAERQKRFAECMQMHCSELWFTLNDSGVGPECAKGIVLALALNERFTSLNLTCNTLGNAGAAIIAKLLLDHRTLIHVDLSANDIGPAGGNSLFEALQGNRSVTYLDLSSKPGSLRNHLARYNANALERLLIANPVLSKLSLVGNSLGHEGAAGLARGLSQNTTLVSLDLAGNDLGPKGFAVLAEALVSCGLEELNLSDNRAGDEGLAALATKLGALPTASSESWTTGTVSSAGGEISQASGKYHEALAALRRTVTDLDPAALGIRDEEQRREALASVSGCATLLSQTLELFTVQLPKLRVLVLAGNNATNAGIARIEDALQVNRCLERLSIDQSDHRLEYGAKSLVTALPVNTTLKHLSLSQCGLSSPSIIDISKALALNQALESLSLRGNPFNENAAAAMGALLRSGAQSLRQLNLSSCRLEDASGAILGDGLATNIALEVLHLRDNLLREAAGKSLAEALRKHTALTTLSLELNSIDFRFLARIKQLLQRNCRLRERARPKFYRQRIEDLKECEKEVKVLTSTMKRNLLKKRKVKIKQAAVLQELKDSQQLEKNKQNELEEKLFKVKKLREGVDREISNIQAELRGERNQGEYDVNYLRSDISSIEDKIKHHRKHMEKTKSTLEIFDVQARQELAALNDELGKKEKERDIASASSEAAHRHLDNFAASMKSIEPDIAGGADPRQRLEALDDLQQPPQPSQQQQPQQQQQQQPLQQSQQPKLRQSLMSGRNNPSRAAAKPKASTLGSANEASDAATPASARAPGRAPPPSKARPSMPR